VLQHHDAVQGDTKVTVTVTLKHNIQQSLFNGSDDPEQAVKDPWAEEAVTLLTMCSFQIRA
jgi:hypothetical protein